MRDLNKQNLEELGGLEPGARAGRAPRGGLGWILYKKKKKKKKKRKVSIPVFSVGNSGRLPVVFTVGDVRPQREE